MQTFMKGVDGFSLLSACLTFLTGSQFFLELEPDKPKLGNDVVLCAFHLGLDGQGGQRVQTTKDYDDRKGADLAQ